MTTADHIFHNPYLREEILSHMRKRRWGHYVPGLVLYSDGVQNCVASGIRNPGVQKSQYLVNKFREPRFDGRVYVPGGSTIALAITGELCSRRQEPPCFYRFNIMDKFDFSKHRGQYAELLNKVLQEIDDLADYLQMPVLKTYKEDVSRSAQSSYLRSLKTYIADTFSSGKLRGQKRFADAKELFLQELQVLEQQIDTSVDFLVEMSAAIDQAKLDGIEQRKEKRVLAAERKRKREAGELLPKRRRR